VILGLEQDLARFFFYSVLFDRFCFLLPGALSPAFLVFCFVTFQFYVSFFFFTSTESARTRARTPKKGETKKPPHQILIFSSFTLACFLLLSFQVRVLPQRGA
jgi:hypothetical protein